MQSTDKTKPTHTDFERLLKTTQLNLRGLQIEWAVLDKTLDYAIEMEKKTRPKDYNPDGGDVKAKTKLRIDGDPAATRRNLPNKDNV